MLFYLSRKKGYFFKRLTGENQGNLNTYVMFDRKSLYPHQ